MAQTEIARLLFQVATLPFVVLGLAHIFLTLMGRLDPVDDQVRQSMSQAPLKFTSKMSMWRSWLGFNLSHGLGVLFFGLIFLLIATYDFQVILKLNFLMPLAVIVSTAYLILALRFWFYAPAIGIAIGLIFFVLSYALASIG